MNVLNVYPDPAGDGGSERSMHVAAAALRAAGHRVYLLHGPTKADVPGFGYDDHIEVPPVFDRHAVLSPSGLAAAERAVDAFVAARGIDLLHVQGWPRTEVLRRWCDKHVVVSTTHVAPCPNNARYHWAHRQACDRSIGLGCLTTGYTKLGCGHLGNGQPVGLPGFVRGMVDDHRLRAAIAGSALIVSPSEWVRNRLVQDGMPADKFRVLPPPMEGPDPVASAAADGDGGPPVVLYVGRLVNFKGADLLLRASARVAAPHRVWIVGDGPARAELEALAGSLGIGGRTEFLGRLPPAGVQARRLASRVAVVPSLWPENFAMVGAEAMRAGLPVVAFNVGGNPEWLKDGVTGRLVTAGDVDALGAAIHGLLLDPPLARRLGRAGAELARRWSPQEHAARLADFYLAATSRAPAVDGPTAVDDGAEAGRRAAAAT